MTNTTVFQSLLKVALGLEKITRVHGVTTIMHAVLIRFYNNVTLTGICLVGEGPIVSLRCYSEWEPHVAGHFLTFTFMYIFFHKVIATCCIEFSNITNGITGKTKLLVTYDCGN